MNLTKTDVFKNFVNELEKLGYSIAIYPVSALYAATKAIIDFCNKLKEDKTSATSLGNMVDFPTFNNMIHLQEIREQEKKFL